MAALLRDTKLDNLTGAFSTFSVALLLAFLQPGEDQTVQLAVQSDAGGVIDATRNAVTADHSTAVKAGALGGAIAINVSLTWLRAQLIEFIENFHLGKLWARLETGGVVGVLILLPLLPLLMLVVLLIFAAVLVGVSLSARAASNYLDARSRVPCDECGYQVRIEASICPKCRTERTPSTATAIGFGAAWQALRKRATSLYPTESPTETGPVR